jgi:tetratricopeptide (TPR) repeat protein
MRSMMVHPWNSLRLTSLVVALLFVAPVVVAGPVIEPTMEPVIRALSTVPKGAPKGTRQAGSKLERDRVEITFVLPSSERATFVLHHPSMAPPGATEHPPFALASPLRADHPLRTAFVAALDREGARFRWALAGTRDSGGTDPLGDARSALRMAARGEVEGAVLKALSLAHEDVGVHREGAALLMAAGFEVRAKKVAQRAQELLEVEDKRDTPGLSGERPSLLALMGAPFDAAAREVLGESPSEERALNACGLTALSDTLSLLDRKKEAARWLDPILKASPGCRAAHHLKCELISLEKRWDALLICAQSGAAAVPDDTDFGVRQATALRGLGRYEEAIVLLEAAVRRRPHAGGPMSSLANLYTMTRTDEAKWTQMEAACEANPQDIVTCFLAGVLAHYLAKHEACVKRMTSLLDSLPSQPRVPMYAAISSFYLGRVEDADRLIARAAKISGAMDPDVYYCRSLIERDRDIPSAMKDLERFLRVASQGWHSEGKIARVTQELAMLRKGVIPSPAEAHHRAEGAPVPEGARSGGGDLRPTQEEASKEQAPADAPDERERSAQGSLAQDEPSSPSPWLWILLGGAGLLVGRFALHRGDP